MKEAINLKVTAEELENQAATVQSAVKKMKNSLDAMNQNISKMGSYWTGDASNKQRNEWKKNQDDVNKILNYLNAYPDQLRKMAGTYTNTESTNKGISEGLASDVIV